MPRQQLLVALIGLLAVDITSVKCVWHDWLQQFSDLVLPQQAPSTNGYGQQNNIERVAGAIARLNEIDPSWTCTNRRNGDQIIFGTEIPNVNSLNNGYPQQSSLLLPYSTGQVTYATGQVPYATRQVPYATGQVPYATGQLPYATEQVPYATGQLPYATGQVPNYNPWLNQRPNQGFVTTPKVDEQQSIFSKPTTIEEVRKKWVDFDWTQYVTVNPTTIAPENEPNVTPPNHPHAGEGIIQARNGV